MPEPKPPIPVAPLRIGDRVRIKGHERVSARIVEFRGPLGPKAHADLAVRVRNRIRHPFSIELRERPEIEPVRACRVPPKTVRLLKGTRRRLGISRLVARRPRPR